MKHAIFVLFVFILFSCNNDTAPTLQGEWEYVGSWVSTGGPVVFQPKTSDEIIRFEPDGTFFTSILYCSGATGTGQSGTYSVSNSEILLDGCASGASNRLFFDMDGDKLTVSTFCIESCSHEYRFVR